MFDMSQVKKTSKRPPHFLTFTRISIPLRLLMRYSEDSSEPSTGVIIAVIAGILSVSGELYQGKK